MIKFTPFPPNCFRKHFSSNSTCLELDLGQVSKSGQLCFLTVSSCLNQLLFDSLSFFSRASKQLSQSSSQDTYHITDIYAHCSAEPTFLKFIPRQDVILLVAISLFGPYRRRRKNMSIVALFRILRDFSSEYGAQTKKNGYKFESKVYLWVGAE